MKPKRNLFILLGIISLFIIGFGIKAVNSDSDNNQSKIAYSESSSNVSQSSTKKESSNEKNMKNKKDKKDKQIVDAQPSSEASSKELKKESKVKEESKAKEGNKSKEESKASTNLEDKTTDKQQQPGKRKVEDASPQSEPTPNKSVPKKGEQKEENIPTLQAPTPAPQVPAPSQPVPAEPEEDKGSVNQPAPPAETPQEIPEEAVPVETVTISVTSDPSVRGMILGNTAVEYIEGDTALDVSMRIWKQQGIQFGITGSGTSVYVKGIANLYEFDEGPQSGWHIRVNGGMIDRSAGAYAIGPGDTINWNYTTNYLEDFEDW